MYDGYWEGGIQHGRGRMVFPDGTEKEGLFADNIFQHELPKSIGRSQSSMLEKQSTPLGLIRGNTPAHNHMRSTKASSGFRIDPYPYNAQLQNRIYKTPANSGKHGGDNNNQLLIGTNHDSRSPFSAIN